MKNSNDIKPIIDANLAGMDLSENAKRSVRQRVSGKRRPSMARVLKLAAMPALALVLAVALAFSGVFSGGGNIDVVNAADLMEGIQPGAARSLGDEESAALVAPVADFSLEVFKNAIKPGENSLVSPTSIYLALGMTANGTGGNTLAQFRDALGGGADIADLNAFYRAFVSRIGNPKEGRLDIANSIWYRDDERLQINAPFLQTNADYYGAAAYKSDFNDPATIDLINGWVSEKTQGLIDGIVERIDGDTVMFLINAIYLDAKWETPYEQRQVTEDAFHAPEGDIQASFMRSMESYYIRDDRAQGFIKPYKGGQLSFVALLPDEGISAEEYAAGLTGGRFISLIENRTEALVETALPKFEAKFFASLNDPLTRMGLTDGFDPFAADFSNMTAHGEPPLVIHEVLHKTVIRVDEVGTVAGAVTSVEMRATGMPMIEHTVILDRPFVYAIIDNATGLPLFIGILQSPQG